MIYKFKKYIEIQGLIKADQQILLAVSGGIDSMVMLHLFLQTDYKFAIAHCNFNLRGKESDADEKLVKDFAIKNKLNFYSKGFDTKQYSLENKCSIQVAAREIRYNYFEEIRKELNYDLIAIAHNKNDSIETFFINLLRGSGIHGLTGIQIRNGRIIRPLLFAERAEIEDYSKKEQIIYREDQSNREEKYLRNKIRHSILKEFSSIDPAYLTKFQDSLNYLNDAKEIFEKQIQIAKEKVIKSTEGRLYINIEGLKQLNPMQTYLFEMIKDFGFNSSQVQNIISSFSKTGNYFYSESHQLLVDRENLIVIELRPMDKNQAEFKVYEETNELEDPLKINFSHETIEGLEIIKDSNYAFLDYQTLQFPLKIRKWKDGDKFIPLGMNGTKKISDFLIDLKVNRNDKQNIFVLESVNEIVWLIGYRLDNRFKVTSNTTEVYKIQII